MTKRYPATLHQQAVEALWEEAPADRLAKIVAKPYLAYIAELEAEVDRLRGSNRLDRSRTRRSPQGTATGQTSPQPPGD